MSDGQVLTVAQMQAAERALVEGGISEQELMERAGAGCADWVWRIAAGRPVTVLCGPGNNGGDGYVIARILSERGLAVKVIAPTEPKTDTARAARSLYKGSVVIQPSQDERGLFIDCLFGSGLSRELAPQHCELVKGLVQSHEYSIAIDVPSGVESDSGALLGDDLPQYDLTLALGAWKRAHFRLPARLHMGEQRLVSIGVGNVKGAARLIGKPSLTSPAPDSHKYTRGLACIVAGAMPGAALLAASACQNSGAGYVKLLGKVGNRPVPADLVVEGGLLEDGLHDDRIRAVLIGPGLGRGDEALERLRITLSNTKSVVLDADALHLLKPEMLRQEGAYCATPHDGELMALCESFDVSAADRGSRALALAQASGMIIIAKGPDTYVASPDGRLAIAPPAPSWLSVAGSGDVLAGIVAARMANARPAFEAACEAIWLHGEAARRAGPAFSASQLAGHVRGAMMSAL